MPGTLVRIPYRDIDFVRSEVAELEDPYGLVPPYDERDVGFTARCVATVNDHFWADQSIFVPMSGASLKEILDFMVTMQKSGLGNFVFPAVWDDKPFSRIAPFLRNYLHHGGRYHLAGGDIEHDLPGIWTWSEEEL